MGEEDARMLTLFCVLPLSSYKVHISKRAHFCFRNLKLRRKLSKVGKCSLVPWLAMLISGVHQEFTCNLNRAASPNGIQKTRTLMIRFMKLRIKVHYVDSCVNIIRNIMCLRNIHNVTYFRKIKSVFLLGIKVVSFLHFIAYSNWSCHLTSERLHCHLTEKN